MEKNDVERFVAEIELVSPFKAQIINKIRSYVSDINSKSADADAEIEERIIYGGVGFFMKGKHFGGAYPNKKHVNLAFSRGVELADPKSLLQGKGKFRRHLQLFHPDELDEKDAQLFVKAAVELEAAGSK